MNIHISDNNAQLPHYPVYGGASNGWYFKSKPNPFILSGSEPLRIDNANQAQTKLQVTHGILLRELCGVGG